MEFWDDVKSTKVYVALRALILYPLILMRSVIYSIIFDPTAFASLERPSGKNGKKKKRRRKKAKKHSDYQLIGYVSNGLRITLAVFLTIVFLILYVQYIVLISFIILLLCLSLVYVIFHKISYRAQKILDSPFEHIRSW